ncbi:MAG: hypothetical protein KF708_10725 [Pirellulales bacterium]|nr:hypothetical protein [Pirellulales bacterium]
MNQPAPPTAAGTPGGTTPPRKRPILRIVLALVSAAVLMVLAAPYLFNLSPVRSAVLSAATFGLHGDISIGRTSLGWFSPVAIYDLSITPDDGGEPLAQVPVIEGDRPLWKLIVDRSELGQFRIERPKLRIEATDRGSNFTEVFGEPPKSEPAEEALPATPPNLGVILAIHDATVVVRAKRAERDLEIPRINVTAGLARSAEPGRAAEFVMSRGKPIDRLAITPELCNDLLKFIAPVLANATLASGEFSIEVEDVRIPLDDPQAGQLAGRFSIHAVRVGPGPLVEELASSLGVPPEMNLANESVVEFEMIDGRVYHQGLQFGFTRLNVRTHGSVGIVDQSLDVVAEVPLAGLAKEDAPLREALSQHTLVIPIKGTLEKPEVDASSLTQNSLDIGLATLQELLGNENISLDALLERLRNRGAVDGAADGTRIFGPGGILSRGRTAPPPPPADPNAPTTPDPADDAAPADEATATEESSGGILGGLLRRRRGTPTPATPPPASPQDPSNLSSPPPTGTAPPSTSAIPGGPAAATQRPARRLLRRALDVAGEAALDAAQQALENPQLAPTPANAAPSGGAAADETSDEPAEELPPPPAPSP